MKHKFEILFDQDIVTKTNGNDSIELQPSLKYGSGWNDIYRYIFALISFSRRREVKWVRCNLLIHEKLNWKLGIRSVFGI